MVIKRFTSKHVIRARKISPIDVGQTRSMSGIKRMNEELGHSFSDRFWHGKIQVRTGKKGSAKQFSKRVFLKPLLGRTLESQIRRGERQERIFAKMKDAGLPSLKAGVVVIEGQAFLAVEPFLRKGNMLTKLRPVNEINGRSKPTFLAKFTVQRHSAIIKDLATDLARIANLGLSTRFFDFHGFNLRGDGSLKRVIMDVNRFNEIPFNQSAATAIIRSISRVWRMDSKEMQLFRKTLLANIKSPELLSAFEKAFAIR